MGHLRRVIGVTLRDKQHRSEIPKARDVKPLLRIERSQLCWFGYVSRMSHKNGELIPSGYSLHPLESGPEFVQGPGGVLSPTLLGPVLVRSQQNYLRLLLIVRYFGSS